MPLYPPEITERQYAEPEQQIVGWVEGAMPASQPIVIVDSNPAWSSWYAAEAAHIVELLGDIAIRIEHVGSTSVPTCRPNRSSISTSTPRLQGECRLARRRRSLSWVVRCRSVAHSSLPSGT